MPRQDRPQPSDLDRIAPVTLNLVTTSARRPSSQRELANRMPSPIGCPSAIDLSQAGF
jgi:hypothetical protein